MKRLLLFSLCVLTLALSGFAQVKKPSMKKSAAGAAPDKAYMQKIWDGWSTLDPANVAKFYATGPHVFFDIAPLKYGSWDEYQSGGAKVLEDFNAARCTVNDDVHIHKSGDVYWITATVAFDMTHKSGKHDMGNFRWTAVFEKQDGKWLIMHEHVS